MGAALENVGLIVLGAVTAWTLLLHWHGTVTSELDHREVELDRRQRLLLEAEESFARRQIAAHFDREVD